MTDKEKLERMKKLADAMYTTAQYLTTDASGLRKAMEEYHKFIIYEYHKQEPMNEDLNLAAHRASKSPSCDNVFIVGAEKFKEGADWQKEQDFNDFARLKKSWYEEGRIHGKFEGLSDDEKYQQGFHDAKEQMMKGAIEGRLGSTVTGSEQYVSAYVGYGEYGKDGDKVKVIIIK